MVMLVLVLVLVVLLLAGSFFPTCTGSRFIACDGEARADRENDARDLKCVESVRHAHVLPPPPRVSFWQPSSPIGVTRIRLGDG